MILYELQCTQGHHFEGWFKDSNSFDRQAKAGKVECPICLDTSVVKAPMAPAVAKKSRKSVSSNPNRRERANKFAKEIIETAAKIQNHVEQNCDYVGNNFAEEARAMHYGEAAERGIYGEATDKEAAELVDEDIPVHKIPWRQRRNS